MMPPTPRKIPTFCTVAIETGWDFAPSGYRLKKTYLGCKMTSRHSLTEHWRGHTAALQQNPPWLHTPFQHPKSTSHNAAARRIPTSQHGRPATCGQTARRPRRSHRQGGTRHDPPTDTRAATDGHKGTHSSRGGIPRPPSKKKTPATAAPPAPNTPASGRPRNTGNNRSTSRVSGFLRMTARTAGPGNHGPWPLHASPPLPGFFPKNDGHRATPIIRIVKGLGLGREHPPRCRAAHLSGRRGSTLWVDVTGSGFLAMRCGVAG